MTEMVRGYCAPVWDRAEIAPGRYERFPPNSIINKTASLRLGHNPASGAGFATAKIMQNAFGYKFEAVIPDCQNARGLARMIREGCDAVSMCFRPIKQRTNGVVTVIEQARLTEISIVPQGAYPSARVWVVGPDLQYATPAIKALVARWDEPERIEYTTESNIQKAAPFPAADDDDDDEEEIETQVADFIWVKETRPKFRPKAQHDPVRQAVRQYMNGYLSRYDKC